MKTSGLIDRILDKINLYTCFNKVLIIYIYPDVSFGRVGNVLAQLGTKVTRCTAAGLSHIKCIFQDCGDPKVT